MVATTFLFCNIRQVSGQSLKLFPQRLDNGSHLIIPQNSERIRSNFFCAGGEGGIVVNVPLLHSAKSQREI